MMEPAERLVASLINRVRINHVQQCVREGVAVFIKQRRTGSPAVIWFANQFLALAHSGVCMIVRADEWADWVRVGALWHGDRGYSLLLIIALVAPGAPSP